MEGFAYLEERMVCDVWWGVSCIKSQKTHFCSEFEIDVLVRESLDFALLHSWLTRSHGRMKLETPDASFWSVDTHFFSNSPSHITHNFEFCHAIQLDSSSNDDEDWSTSICFDQHQPWMHHLWCLWIVQSSFAMPNGAKVCYIIALGETMHTRVATLTHYETLLLGLKSLICHCHPQKPSIPRVPYVSKIQL